MREILENVTNNWIQLRNGDENDIFLRHAKEGKSSILLYLGKFKVHFMNYLYEYVNGFGFTGRFRYHDSKHQYECAPAFYLQTIKYAQSREWILLVEAYTRLAVLY